MLIIKCFHHHAIAGLGQITILKKWQFCKGRGVEAAWRPRSLRHNAQNLSERGLAGYEKESKTCKFANKTQYCQNSCSDDVPDF
jgi:hypothetical protein